MSSWLSILAFLAAFCYVLCSASPVVVLEADVGAVPVGALVHHTFDVRNTSDDIWETGRPRSSCSCTVAEELPASIAAGATVSIPATYNASKPGHFREIIRVPLHGAADGGMLTLVIAGLARGDTALLPRRLVIDSGSEEGSAVQLMCVTGDHELESCSVTPTFVPENLPAGADVQCTFDPLGPLLFDGAWRHRNLIARVSWRGAPRGRLGVCRVELSQGQGSVTVDVPVILGSEEQVPLVSPALIVLAPRTRLATVRVTLPIGRQVEFTPLDGVEFIGPVQRQGHVVDIPLKLVAANAAIAWHDRQDTSNERGIIRIVTW